MENADGLTVHGCEEVLISALAPCVRHADVALALVGRVAFVVPSTDMHNTAIMLDALAERLATDSNAVDMAVDLLLTLQRTTGAAVTHRCGDFH